MEKKHKKSLKTPAVNTENHDTIGMLAIDNTWKYMDHVPLVDGHIKCMEELRDSPIIGAGLFVDNEIGAACATGVGESIIKIAGSHTVVGVHEKNGYSPQEACEEAIKELLKNKEMLKIYNCCFIAIDKFGNTLVLTLSEMGLITQLKTMNLKGLKIFLILFKNLYYYLTSFCLKVDLSISSFF